MKCIGWENISIIQVTCKQDGHTPYRFQPWRWMQNVSETRGYPLPRLHGIWKELLSCFFLMLHVPDGNKKKLMRKQTHRQNLNNWVMHPVPRVSIIYWKTSIRNTVFLVLDFIVHFSHYMFRPRLAAIFTWFTNTKNIQGSHHIFNGSVE
jgi:hypothetical protein